MSANAAKITAVLPVSDWIKFRWALALTVLPIISGQNMEAGRAAIHSLTSTDDLTVTEWRGQVQYVIMPLDAWIGFRWEIALNVIEFVSSVDKAAAKAANEIVIGAEKLVVHEAEPATT